MDVVEKGDLFGAPQRVKVKKARRTRNEIFLQEAMYGPPRQCKNCGQIIRLADGRTKCNWLGYDQGSASDINPEYVCKYWKAPAQATIGKTEKALSQETPEPIRTEAAEEKRKELKKPTIFDAMNEIDKADAECDPDFNISEAPADDAPTNPAPAAEEEEDPALEQMRRELEMPPMGDLF